MRWLLACLLLSVVPAFAQPKPIGAFSSEGAPDWVSFGAISGDASPAQMEAAAARSRATGLRADMPQVRRWLETALGVR